MVTEGRELSPKDPTLTSEIFSARDRLEKAFEEKVDGFRERDIERRIPGAGMMQDAIGDDLQIDGILYSDIVTIRTTRSAHDNSLRTHEQRITSRRLPTGERVVVQFDTTHLGGPINPYGIDTANQVAARMTLVEANGEVHKDRAAIERVDALQELFVQTDVAA